MTTGAGVDDVAIDEDAIVVLEGFDQKHMVVLHGVYNTMHVQ